MKKLLLSIFPFLVCLSLKAQDTILKTDQTEISAKVTEITPDEVKFKYFNRLDGPTYTLNKSEIFVIIYQDGTREKFSSTNTAPTQSAFTKTSDPKPVKSGSTSSYSTLELTEPKRSGWTYGLNYATPSQAFGQAHGLGLEWGYYFLGKGRKGGGLIDSDVMYFFNNGQARYGLISLNGIFRGSETSRFYLGGGIGLGSVSVEVSAYDYGLKRTNTTRVGDIGFGGKAFMGYGLFRVTVLTPSFQSVQGAGLVTIGLHTNPFTK